MPVNALLIRVLLSFYLYYGDSFKVSDRLRNPNETVRSGQGNG